MSKKVASFIINVVKQFYINLQFKIFIVSVIIFYLRNVFRQYKANYLNN